MALRAARDVVFGAYRADRRTVTNLRTGVTHGKQSS